MNGNHTLNRARCSSEHTARRVSVRFLASLVLLISIGIALAPTTVHAQSVQVRRERRITREPLPIYVMAPVNFVTPKAQNFTGYGLTLAPASTQRVLTPSRVPRATTATTVFTLPRPR